MNKILQKFISLVITALIFSSLIKADASQSNFSTITVEIIPMYSTISMPNLDNLLNTMKNNYINNNYHVSMQSPFSVVDTELAFNFLSSYIPGLSLSMKAGYLYIFPAYIHAKRGPQTSDNYNYEWDNDFTFSFIPVLVGVTYNYSIPKKPFFMSASAYAGAAVATTEWTSKFTTDNPSWTQDEISSWNFTNQISGMPFIAETNLGLGVKISKNSSFQIILGYRFAYVNHLSYSYDTSKTYSGDLKTGTYAMGITSNSIELDFSGLLAGAAVTYKF